MTDFPDGPPPPRDHELGAALRALDVPDHRDGFFADLRAGLGSPAAADHVVLPLSPAAVRGRRHWRRQSLRVAVMAAAAGVIGVAVGINLDSTPDRDSGRTPRVVALPSAVEVAQRVQGALSAVRTLRGEMVFRDADGEARSRFVVTDAGDFRNSSISRAEELAYDAETGIERSYFLDPTGPDFGGERRGLSSGAPDDGPSLWVLQRELGSTVRALLAEDAGLSVTETSYDGRPAWALDTDVEPNKIGGGGDHLRVTVDRETGFPVRVVETIAGAPFRELRLEQLVVNTPVDRTEFTIEFPAGVELFRHDAGWRRVPTVGEARGEVGYAPLVPNADALPEGFALARVAVVDRAQGTGVEGLNPPTRKAVSLAFHRGLDRILVTTRLRGGIVDGREPGTAPGRCSECLGESSWSDPLASGEGFFDDPDELSVAGGALAGSPAQLLVGPHTVPHVWALGDDLVVTVSGDATRAELVRILESMEPHTG